MTCQHTPVTRLIVIASVVGLAILVGWRVGRYAGNDNPSDHAQPAAAPGTFPNVGGKIVKIMLEEGIVTVDHEEIKGFMPAMVMDLKVAEPRELAGLNPGQAIRFDLVKLKGQYLMVRIRPASSVEERQVPDSHSPSASPQTGVNPLERGDQVPDLLLTDSQGKEFRLRDLPMRHKLVTFFYTRCPLDNFCPAQSRRLSQLQKWIDEQQIELHLVSLTLDAGHDNAGVLSSYAEHFAADPARWTIAGGGNPAAIRDFANRVGARVQPEQSGFRIDHALVAVRLDGDRIVDFAYGLDAMERLVRGMAAGPQPPAAP